MSRKLDFNVPNLNEIPDICLEKILENLNYEEISRLRLVSRRFDHACQKILNHGFHDVQKYHAQCLKELKAQLPRRESQRRNHHLAKHVDILNSVETRLSLLTMTYSKYMDSDMCCFIPGKVLDELYSVIRYIMDCKTAPRTSSELLQELRDISSMAMEHFEEKVVPILKNSDSVSSPFPFQILSSGSTGTPRVSFTPKLSGLTSGNESSRVVQLAKTVAVYKSSVRALKTQVDEHQKKLIEQDRLLTELNRKLAALINDNPQHGIKRKGDTEFDSPPIKSQKISDEKSLRSAQNRSGKKESVKKYSKAKDIKSEDVHESCSQPELGDVDGASESEKDGGSKKKSAGRKMKVKASVQGKTLRATRSTVLKS